MSEEDAALVNRVLDGDQHAFEALVSRHIEPAQAIARSVVYDPSAADDVVQEAFIRAHAHLGKLANPRLFPSWLYRIVRNEAISWLRRQKRHKAKAIDPEQLTAPPDTGDDEAANAKALAMHRALQKLRPAYREILALKYEADMSYDDIAEALNTSSANVEKKLYRARQRLLKLLESNS